MSVAKSTAICSSWLYAVFNGSVATESASASADVMNMYSSAQHESHVLWTASDRSHSIRGEITDRCYLLVNHKFLSWLTHDRIISRQVQGSTPKSLFTLGGQKPHLTQCVIGPSKYACQVACISVERLKQGERVWQTTDRQTTDHATEKWVACATATTTTTTRGKQAELTIGLPASDTTVLAALHKKLQADSAEFFRDSAQLRGCKIFGDDPDQDLHPE